MNIQALLQWNNMIFILPMAIGAMLLFLSTMRLGHHAAGHHGGHMGGKPGGRAGGQGHAHSAAAPSHGVASHRVASHTNPAPAQPRHALAAHSTHRAANRSKTPSERANIHVTNSLVLRMNGARRAPLIMVAEAFLLLWGICGMAISRAMVTDPAPSPGRMLPALGLTLVAGLVGAKLAAMLIARILPPDETLVVSGDALFGMTGSVTFPVTEETGRIHVYDQFGTLHDETCRVAPGHPPIERGRSAMIVDRDAGGNLIVEEVPARQA